MRTNIEIDDELMSQALRMSDSATKKAVVREALQLFIQTKQQLKRQARIRDLHGKIQWEGDLEQSRKNRLPDDARTR